MSRVTRSEMTEIWGCMRQTQWLGPAVLVAASATLVSLVGIAPP